MIKKYKIDWPKRAHFFNEKEIKLVSSILRDQNSALTFGPYVAKFENDFAKFVKVKRAFSTMSCAHSLDIAAMVLDIKKGDEVILPSHTYCATALAFSRRGAILKWADIELDSFCISLRNIEKLVTKKTKAIIVVHLYGLICPDIKKISSYAKKNKIYLIEDCAQSFGSYLNKKSCGTFGDIGCFSFQSQKNLTTLGEGGMIIAKSNSLLNKIKNLRFNGHREFKNQTKYWLPATIDVNMDIKNVHPIKSTMTEIQGAVGSLLLKKFKKILQKRRNLFFYIRHSLSDIKELKFQTVKNLNTTSAHLLPAVYLNKKNNRDSLIDILSTKFKIKSVTQYYPLHKYKFFIKLGFGNIKLKNTEFFYKNMISFPFNINLTKKQINYQIKSIRSSIKELSKK